MRLEAVAGEGYPDRAATRSKVAPEECENASGQRRVLG